MQIGVANPAVQDVDQNIFWSKVAPLKIKLTQWRSSTPRGVTCNTNHDVPELREEAAAANSLN
jgi:hypothetical protein